MRNKIIGILIGMLLLATAVPAVMSEKNYTIKTTAPSHPPSSITGSWLQEAKLTASDGSTGSFCGASVAIDGDYAIVGAFFASIKGAADIYKRTGTTWTQQARLNASDGANGDQFGNSVSISGEYAIVSAHTHNGNKGAAYIFKRTDTTWAQETAITAADTVTVDLFSFSVSLQNDTTLIGALWAENGTGAAYVFTRSGTTWTQQAKLTTSDGASGDAFGCSVSLDGDSAIIGAQYAHEASGSAYVFTHSGSTWTQQAKLTASNPAPNNQFGISVSISGDSAIVGEGGNLSTTGYAHFFSRTGSNWVQQAKLNGSGSHIGDGFGWSVSIDGTYAIAGAPGGDYYNGSAYIFRHTGTTWVEEAKLAHSDPVPGDFLGYSVAIDKGSAISGAFQKDGQTGAAYIFRKLLEPNLEIGVIKGGFGLTTKVNNTGLDDATDVTWNITVTGGLLGRINKKTEGTIASLPAGESASLKLGMFLGLGKITITITATCNEGASAEKTANGKQFIIYSIVE